MAKEHVTPFGGSMNLVAMKAREGGGPGEKEDFMCDEEPHILTPEHGYGYFPLMLGHKLNDNKYEIVRKLGWGQFSSVWLAKVARFVIFHGSHSVHSFVVF
jgi:serine/threonine-protein kinase SRPK3